MIDDNIGAYDGERAIGGRGPIGSSFFGALDFLSFTPPGDYMSAAAGTGYVAPIGDRRMNSRDPLAAIGDENWLGQILNTGRGVYRDHQTARAARRGAGTPPLVFQDQVTQVKPSVSKGVVMAGGVAAVAALALILKR